MQGRGAQFNTKNRFLKNERTREHIEGIDDWSEENLPTQYIEQESKTAGGIIIPDTAKEKPMESVVVALGTGKTDENGKKVPFEVKKGDRVLVSKYGGTEIKIDGRELKILSADDILAILE